MANTPPLLPPIGSDDPDGGSPVPPLGGAPGMPPPLVPIADIGGDSSGDDDSDDSHSDDDDDGNRDRDRSDDQDAVDLGESAYTVALARGSGQLRVSAAGDADIEEIARAFALAEPPIDIEVGVLELGGDLVSAGRFPFTDEHEREEAETAAQVLLERIAELPAELFPFDESLLCIPGAFPCPPEDERKKSDGQDPAEFAGDLPAPLVDVEDIPSEERPGDDEPGADPELDAEEEESSADEDAEEAAPADQEDPGRN
jgi:hypothetical protein